jgi:hypothetical protein
MIFCWPVLRTSSKVVRHHATGILHPLRHVHRARRVIAWACVAVGGTGAVILPPLLAPPPVPPAANTSRPGNVVPFELTGAPGSTVEIPPFAFFGPPGFSFPLPAPKVETSLEIPELVPSLKFQPEAQRKNSTSVPEASSLRFLITAVGLFIIRHLIN